MAKATGRPTSYTKEKADIILSRMAEGETLTDICKGDDFPARASVYRWQEADPEFRAAFERARDWQGHAIAEGAYLRGRDAKDAAVDRLAFDAGRWFASKMLPATYGDKILHTGGDGINPIELAQKKFEHLSTEALCKIKALMVGGEE